MITRKVFLDLEETIIESWDNPIIMNHKKISKFLRNLDITHVGIFSFAIWNDEDKVNFERFEIKQMIEQSLQVFVGKVLTVPEMADEVFWKQGTVIEPMEFIQLWGKQRAFLDWAMMQPRFDEGEQEFILIDDVVSNVTLIDDNHGGDFRVKTININSL